MASGKKNIKQVLFSFLAIFILIVAVIGISYAVWSRTFKGEKDNSLTTATVSFNYTESETNHINLTNALPMSDTNGKKLNGDQEVFDFTVTGNYGEKGTVLYDVYVTPYDMTLSDKYVKIYVTDQHDNPVEGYDRDEVPTYNTLEDYSIPSSTKDTFTTKGKLLYSSELTPERNSHDLRVRVWLSSSYGSSGNKDENTPEKSLTFAFKVNVRGRI
ncbi:MAG: hypothetical protein HFJ12_06385 [Bacilli bacterium]|nr:hypothetical protein [Bacilli bacterium]